MRGIEPVIGDLDDADILADAARRADAVVNAASSDHRPAVDTLLGALAGSGKPFLHTSGTSVLADDARGEPSDAVYDETTPFTPLPERAARAALDAAVLAAAERGVRSVVLCNSLIYGHGPGLHAESVQIPTLVRVAHEADVPRHIGRGLNVWSTVHVEDVADLYLLALERAEPGSFLFVENGRILVQGAGRGDRAGAATAPPRGALAVRGRGGRARGGACTDDLRLEQPRPRPAGPRGPRLATPSRLRRGLDRAEPRPRRVIPLWLTAAAR